MSRELLEEAVVKALKSLGPATYEELRDYLVEREVGFRDMELREVLARLVREGKVGKLPDPGKLKLLFTLKE